VLFPALVIGLGQAGLAVLQRLRECFRQTFGAVDALPNIHWLHVDTDPAAQRLTAGDGAGPALSSAEILQTRLNRPSHYLRAYKSQPRLESWFDLKMLYRIPRNPATTGLRLLGRLAFFDNYRRIAARLKTELEACSRPDVLASVARLPGFGLRTLRPRVYVVTSLAGGTGSGIFLDLAYVLRKLLKAQGEDSPDLVGIFLLPAVDRSPDQTLAMANTFAALTELNHFSAPETCFWAHYDDNEPPLRDTEPPYDRCFLMPLPAARDDSQSQAPAGLIADWLYNDLTTSLGRTADETRAGVLPEAPSSWTLTCHTFGMYQISWPKFSFLRHVGSSLCQQLVRSWMSKDSTPVRERVKVAVAEEWGRLGLGGDHLLTRLHGECEQAYGQNPEAAFAALVEPLARLDSLGTDLTPAAQIVDQLEQLVGRPGESVGSHTGALKDPLDAAADVLSTDLSKLVASFVNSFIEQSGTRLAGAEEAVRELISLIEQELRKQEDLGRELSARAESAHTRIKSLLTSMIQDASSKNRRAATSVNGLVELMRCYPKWRYQSLMIQRVSSFYVSLRGQLSDQLREINYCRTRLMELLGSFEQSLAKTAAEENRSTGRLLFPAGFRTLPEAAKEMRDSITAEELWELDIAIQKLLREQFRGLMHVCLSSANLLANLEAGMQREAESFIEARLAGVSVADMYMAHQGDEREAYSDLDVAFEEAAPLLSAARGSRAPEVCILGVPSGPVGERFRDLARRALPDVEMVPAAGTNDIIFYREVPHLRLSDLEQLGPLGYEAYRQIVTLKNLTPHSRTDITEWRAAGG
jgi:hypothetical protein